MSDDRLIHEIADRYDPRWLPQRSRDRREYAPPERPSEIRRWRRRLIWLAGLAAAAVVFVPLVTNDHRAFQARPVSAAHRLYESDCSLCHDRKGRAAWRLIPGVQAHSVSDAACMNCHRELASSDHHAERHVSGVLETSQSCAQCHVEHLGTEGLFALADQKCVQCHRDLRVAGGGTTAFASRIGRFAEHPEFAILDPEAVAWRVRSSAPGEGDSQGAWHLAWLRAALATSDPAAAPRDASHLRFNHAAHLRPLPLLPDDPQYAPDSVTTLLSCDDCHQPTTARDHFQPIAYERHCQRCHRLNLVAGAELELPHESPAIIRGLLRDRLHEYLASLSGELRDRSGGPQRSDPLAPGTEAVLSTEQWLQQALQALGPYRMQVAPATSAASPAIPSPRVEGGSLPQVIRQACGYCHATADETPQEPTGLGWNVVAPSVPDRWMPHARFNHRAHDTLSCQDCHARPGAAGGEQAAPERMGATSDDILMPSIESCRGCHGDAPQQASARCTSCHDYHRRGAGGPLDPHDSLR